MPARPRSEKLDAGSSTCAIDGPTCVRTATTQNMSNLRYRNMRSNPQPLTTCFATLHPETELHGRRAVRRAFTLYYVLGGLY